ncbi:MAG TPA: GatB/YqeY domain-containing protein [Rhizomicrobium sp.]|nr:GatB/YqeY domain-containing protein [Rhizomicrobium sp.]
MGQGNGGLRDRFNSQLKEAMKARDNRRVSTLRMVLAALKDKDIAARTETSREGISDDDVLALLAKMIKQREESAAAYKAGGRPELAQSEEEEIAIIRGFMPRQMSAEESRAAIGAAIAETGAASMKDMGKLMAALKARYAGQMDFAKASGLAKELLGAAK